MGVNDFEGLFIDKDVVLFRDAITGDTIKRSIYADEDNHNYFIYNGAKVYFTVDVVAIEES